MRPPKTIGLAVPVEPYQEELKMSIHKSVFLRTVTLAALALSLSLAFVDMRADAITISECQSLITSLRIETETVVIPGNNAEKLRPALLNKLESASISLDREKFCDAIRKLDDYRVKVNQLVASGGINTDPTVGVTGNELANASSQAMICVQSLVTQTGGTCPSL
jgi:superfamily I DNA and RNA helicase